MLGADGDGKEEYKSVGVEWKSGTGRRVLATGWRDARKAAGLRLGAEATLSPIDGDSRRLRLTVLSSMPATPARRRGTAGAPGGVAAEREAEPSAASAGEEAAEEEDMGVEAVETVAPEVEALAAASEPVLSHSERPTAAVSSRRQAAASVPLPSDPQAQEQPQAEAASDAEVDPQAEGGRQASPGAAARKAAAQPAGETPLRSPSVTRASISARRALQMMREGCLWVCQGPRLPVSGLRDSQQAGSVGVKVP